MSEGKSQQQQHLSIELDFENKVLQTPHTADSAGHRLPTRKARIGQQRVGDLLVQVYERLEGISPEKVLLKLTKELVSFSIKLLSVIRLAPTFRLVAPVSFFQSSRSHASCCCCFCALES
jgi:hypothetical protein